MERGELKGEWRERKDNSGERSGGYIHTNRRILIPRELHTLGLGISLGLSLGLSPNPSPSLSPSPSLGLGLRGYITINSAKALLRCIELRCAVGKPRPSHLAASLRPALPALHCTGPNIKATRQSIPRKHTPYITTLLLLVNLSGLFLYPFFIFYFSFLAVKIPKIPTTSKTSKATPSSIFPLDG